MSKYSEKDPREICLGKSSERQKLRAVLPKGVVSPYIAVVYLEKDEHYENK